MDADAPPTVTVPAPICYNGTPFTIGWITDALASATILPTTYKVEPIASLNTVAYLKRFYFYIQCWNVWVYIKDGNGCVAFVDYSAPTIKLIPTLTKGLECLGTPLTITLNTEMEITSNIRKLYL